MTNRKKASELRDEQQASALQSALWTDFMADRWRYRKAGWVDPFWDAIEEQYNRFMGFDFEPEPQVPKGNGGSKPVYVLLDETPVLDNGQAHYRVKIGLGNAEQRKQATTLPGLSIVWQEAGGRDRERQLHALFTRDRVDGSEWFMLSPTIRGYLAERGVNLDHLDHKPQIAETKPGRPKDVPSVEELTFLVKNPDLSNKELYRKFGWRNEKAKRFKEYAAEVAAQFS